MKDKGFAPIIIVIITTLAIGAGVGGFLVLREKKKFSSQKPIQQEVSLQSPAQPVQSLSPKPRQSTVESPRLLPSPISQPSSSPQVQVEAKDKPPVLKNLGIVLDIPNLQTNRAGDMLFDKIVIWEDDNLYSDKAFGDFGEMGKSKNEPNYPGVEYNYAVPAGTKVYAAGDGIANIFNIEHTNDWGINIQPQKGSQWNIGHEHMVNLTIKDGDTVRAGDILGEATPYWKGYAVTQLAVWTGGRDGIVKYCPFSFLEDNLEPAYGEKLKRIANDWEEFTGKDVYKQEDWIAPGCLMDKIIESSGN